MKLGVNIDHIATLRETRHGSEPEPVFAALICEAAGADSIVVHLREDRRHVQERDVCLLRQVVKTKLNLEMSINSDIVDIACKVKPDQVTLVPEKRKELTTEGGLNVLSNYKSLEKVLNRLKKNGIGVSLFIDPELKQIEAAKELGLSMIELHTGRFAESKTKKEKSISFNELRKAAIFSKEQGFNVFAGHGLDYHNVNEILKIDVIEELNIGYAIVCRAVIVGLEKAVCDMKVLINK